MRENMASTPEATVESLQGVMKRVHPVGEISLHGLDRYIRDRIAFEHAYILHLLMVLDHDFDGTISDAELSARFESIPTRHVLEGADTNGDGDLDSTEIRAAIARHVASPQGAPKDVESAEQLREVMIFDQDGDGTVTIEEMRAGAEALRPD